jgi:hypothetical protein
MKQPIVILISASVVTVSFIGWRVHAMKHQRVNHFEVVHDPSLSFTGGCSSLIGAAESVLGSPRVSTESTLTVLALGDGSTAYEPRRLATYAVPTNRKVIEGRHAGIERRERLLRDLEAQCRSVQPTLVTPIYIGVKQAVADLQTQGCKEGSQCGLWVSSDLEENGVRAIEERINRARHPKEPLPEPLDNSGIEVTFCGFAQTAGHLVDPSGREIRRAAARDPRRDDRLQTVWRALFTKSELVKFEPYCPVSSFLPTDQVTAGREHAEAGLNQSPDDER